MYQITVWKKIFTAVLFCRTFSKKEKQVWLNCQIIKNSPRNCACTFCQCSELDYIKFNNNIRISWLLSQRTQSIHMYIHWLENRSAAMNPLLLLMPSQKTGLVLENSEWKYLNESPEQVKLWQPRRRAVFPARMRGWVGEARNEEMLWSLIRGKSY